MFEIAVRLKENLDSFILNWKKLWFLNDLKYLYILSGKAHSLVSF